jgi:hypothetical protein
MKKKKENKNYFKPLIFISIASIIIAIMYFQSPTTPPLHPPGGQDTITSNLLKKANIMGQGAWDKETYTALKSKIETLSSGNDPIVNTEDAIKLKDILESQYASAMAKSYENWKNSNGSSNIDNLYSAMQNQINIKGCRDILEKPLSVIGKYKKALGLPSAVNAFTQTEYTEAKSSAIQNELKEYCENTPELLGFPEIQNIKNQVKTELLNFYNYATNFNSDYEYYKINSSNVVRLLNYCPNSNPNTIKYQHYLSLIESLNVCN